MFFLKKIFLILFFIIAMYVGGSGTQTDSTFLQGIGFVAVILALVVLYILFKIMWRAMSFLPSFLIIGSVVVFILYCLGLLGGKNNVNLFSSVSNNKNMAVSSNGKVVDEHNVDIYMEELEMFGLPPEAEIENDKVIDNDKNVSDNVNSEDTNDVSVSSNVSQNDGGFVGKVKTFLFGNNVSNNNNMYDNFNPMDYPSIQGYPSVVTASVLYVRGIYVKLFGVDAPDPGQSCADRQGRSYKCGKRALTWLQNWLNNRNVVCYILGDVDEKNRATGVCLVDDQYDVAAVVTNAGWAVAYTQNTEIYLPYEKQAIANRRGLWKGRFYKPWDWRKMQNRKVKIKINKNKPESGGIWDLF